MTRWTGCRMIVNSEKLKRDWTDKYVVVTGNRPELARFGGAVGQVKTVNMSGRCLVQFECGDANIGWFDIEPTYLALVPAPDPNAAPAKKEAPAKAAKPVVEKAAQPAAAVKPAAEATPAAVAKGGRPSVAEILAAAKANKSAVATAAAPAAAAPPPAGKKLSTAEILAAARKPVAAAAAPPAAEEVAVEEDAPEPVAAAPAAPPAAKPSAGGPLPTDTAGRIAWCREHDKR